MRAAPERLTVGLEEEYLLVDPLSRKLGPYSEKVVAAAAPELGERVGTELTRYQVEARTEVHTDLSALTEQVRAMRAAVTVAAEQQGVRAISSGTPVLDEPAPPPVVPDPRYTRSVAAFRALDDEQTVCACHIHIGMPDHPAGTLQVSNRLRPWLPVLVALLANSPYWAGRDTGYASWRTMVWARWPVAGPPPYFESPAHFDELVGRCAATGAIMDRSGLYWDIRPSHHVPTLEVRVADAAYAAEDTALLAAVVRALADTALRAAASGEPAPRPEPEMLRAACWRAARDGLTGHAVDPLTGRLVPARTHVRRMLSWIRPALHRHGDLEVVRAGWARLCAEGNGADRQRAVHRRRSNLHDVVDHLALCMGPPAGSV
ncbi:glutamate--cysteine ligase [Streptomyces sp. MZ04]|uniref:carboxylate-amine ligase n=1 Tax=Streptomyces sp. MZ04 TaxID=2559236 RepID=UPI001FD85B28|nr:glutamate--cysteine ligase [Streptomyces sp. MZ04]